MYRLLKNEDSEPVLPRSDKEDLTDQGVRGSLFWIFFVALSIRLWFCFFHGHLNAYAAFDAVGYINAAKAIFELNTLPVSFAKDCWLTLFGLAPTTVAQVVHTKLASLQPLLISGPAYPIFLLLSNIMTFSGYDRMDWIKPVSAQCMISATTVMFIAAIARQLFDRKTGVIAGTMAAIYPPFIINCGRACTETFAAFLLCLFSYILLYIARVYLKPDEQKEQRKHQIKLLIGAAVLLGILAALLELTRSVLLLLTAVAIFTIALRLKGKHRIIGISSFIVGFALVIVPWFGAQQLIAGRVSLVVDRVSRLNYGLGNQVETQGWTGYPLHFDPIMDRTTYAQTLNLLSTDPAGYVWLLQDKLPRLFKCGWNDFKTNIGFFTAAAQDVLHQFIILFAIAGIILSVDGVREATNAWRSRMTGILFLLVVLASHLPYLFFITVDRYNLTAMPFLIVFGAWGIRRLRQLGNFSSGSEEVLELAYPSIYLLFGIFVLVDPATWLVNAFGERGAAEIGMMTTVGIKTLMFLIVVGLTFFLINQTQSGKYSRSFSNIILIGLSILTYSSICLPVRAHGRWYERSVNLTKPGEGMTFELYTPPAVSEAVVDGKAYLMIDAENLDSLNNGLSIAIDGRNIPGPFIPGISLMDNVNQFERRQTDLTRVAECLFESFTNIIGIGNNDIRQWFFVSIPAQTEPSLLDSKVAGAYRKRSMRITIKRTDVGKTRLFKSLTRDDGELTVPNWQYYSWDKAFYGVERRGNVCDPRTDKTMKQHRGDSGNYIRLLVPSTKGDANRQLPLSYHELAEPVIVNRKISNGNFKSLIMSPLPPYEPDDTWLVRLSGRYRTSKTNLPPAVEMLCKSVDKDIQYQYNAPWAPRNLKTSAEWANFDVAMPLKPSAFPGKMNRIELRMHAISPLLNELTFPLDSERVNNATCEFKNVRIEIKRLETPLLEQSHAVY